MVSLQYAICFFWNESYLFQLNVDVRYVVLMYIVLMTQIRNLTRFIHNMSIVKLLIIYIYYKRIHSIAILTIETFFSDKYVLLISLDFFFLIWLDISNRDSGRSENLGGTISNTRSLVVWNSFYFYVSQPKSGGGSTAPPRLPGSAGPVG